MKAFIYYVNLVNIVPINIIFYFNAMKQLPSNDLTVDMGRYCTTNTDPYCIRRLITRECSFEA